MYVIQNNSNFKKFLNSGINIRKVAVHRYKYHNRRPFI